MVETLHERLEQWLADAEEVSQRWEAYLTNAEDQMVSGAFARLLDLAPSGEQITRDMQEIQRRRYELLRDAALNGVSLGTLQEVDRVLSGDHHQKRWERLRRQMQQQQVRALSVWTHMRYANQHLNGVLRLFSTGKNFEATYDRRESRQMEGGILIDQSA